MKKTIYIFAGLLILVAVMSHAFTKQTVRQTLTLTRDQNRVPVNEAFRQSNYIDRVNLELGTLKAVLSAASASKVIFSSTADFYLRIGKGQEMLYAIVASDITSGYGFELIKAANGAIRTISHTSREYIGMVTAASGAVVTMMFYK